MRAKHLALYMIIYSFIAAAIGYVVINVESLGLLGTNTMESSCHYSNPTYLNTIWQNEACGFTLESLIVLWTCMIILAFIGVVASYKLKKESINGVAKWLYVFVIILFMTAFKYWQNDLLTLSNFYKLGLGTLSLLSPFFVLNIILIFWKARND